jgi:hypothetical protein
MIDTVLTSFADLLNTLDLRATDEIFNVRLLPSTVSDKAYSCVLTRISSPIVPDKVDRHYPVAHVEVDMMHNLGRNNRKLYNEALGDSEAAIAKLINPDNYADGVREISFTGADYAFFTEGGYWVITTITLEVEYDMLYT